MLVSCTETGPRRWRLFLVDFLVRMWRLNAWPRLTVPPGRTRKRFFAPLLVFILGMECSFSSCAREASRKSFRALMAPSHLFGALEGSGEARSLPSHRHRGDQP